MELFYSDKYFVLQNEDESLWVNRENGAFSTKSGGRDSIENNPTLFLIGRVFGFVGTLRLSSAAEPRLVFIRSQEQVCKIKDHDVYKITSVVSVPLESECEVEVEWIPSKSKQEVSPTHTGTAISPSATPQHKPQGVVAEPTTPVLSWNRGKIPACPNSRKYGGRVDRTEKRLLDEYYKMFMEADSFYYSNGHDIFNSLQRQTQKQPEANGGQKENSKHKEEPKSNELEGKESDERFFWNYYMLSDILSKDPPLQKWAISILQGSIQHAICELDPNARISQGDAEIPPPCLELILISRRSRHRAGTRYLKRGVDDQGKVANYVETEQIVVFRGHLISFVQTRGSVPVFWSQPGYKYRPPILLDKSIEESIPSFEKHMDEELKLYGQLNLINLVEKIGREKVLEDAYRKCVLLYNSENILYVTFDFHNKCRGLKFDNVKLLTESVAEVIKSMAYCWVDSYGTVMQQNGTFRVNCVDCLDRTNVVQSFLAREVLSLQLSKIGLLLPEVGLSESIRKKFLEVWANNGDIISKQYAGTNALKGDFTRTGERRFAGVMRDGMNSANRYLNNRLKDGTRQACIDLILGVRSSVSEEELTLEKEAVEEKDVTTELIMQTIEDVRHCLVPAQSIVIGSWGLVDAKTNEVGTVEVDTVLVLTESECFVAIYDWTLDTIASSTKINLNCVTSLEIISEPIAQSTATGVWGLFHAPAYNSQSCVPSLKLHFVAEEETKEYFHFRSSNLRFFNNCLTQIGHPDEMMEALKMVAETVKAAVFASSKKAVPVTIVQAAAPTPPKSIQKGVPGINAWIPRWNTGATPATTSAQEANPEPVGRKFNPVSMQRFTPNFLKKKRTNVDEDTTIKTEGILGGRVPDLPLPQSLKVSDEPSMVSQQLARTPMERGSPAIHEQQLMDLFLPSCGIVSVPIRSAPTLQIGLTHEVLTDGIKTSPGLSPVTPLMDAASQDVTPTSTDTTPSLKLLLPPDYLSRHRYSLPTSSLGIGITVTSPNAPIGRPTTPEIRITEEPAQCVPIHINPLVGGSSLAAASNQKRMSRSTEDINQVAPAATGTKMFSSSFMNKVPVSLKHKLVPNLPHDSRSTSDQDIFSSLVHMKGSHSENAIKDGNAIPAQKRDVVFAPLGKLARGMQSIGVNYLDPRKLRDTLRQPRQEIVAQEDPEIIELMKTTKSRIIDI